MSQKSVFAALFSLCLAVPMSVSAQESDPARRPASEAVAGAKIDDGENGFRLVTHGDWGAPSLIARPIEQAPRQLSAPDRKTPKLKRTASARSNFRRATYLPHVRAAEAQYRLPHGLLDALIWTESRYNPLAVSHAGAAGLGQLMPKTARELGVANRFDPAENLLGAARYLRQMLDKFELVHLAVAAYNAGPGAVKRAGGIPLNGETPGYVQSVLAFWGAE